ncbi:hypothetical protein ACFHYQ_13130 [Sphaerimonospora cavernae]|uniref:MarR family transcriptional regulator n=1 Tax=Sphaerimonospora cavernae TaxID=1740611 RepID=A0ABV6U443_9ACTN
MAEKKLTSSQMAALLVLMAEAREISNPELGQLYSFTLTGKDRNKLNDLKLVDSRKGRQGAFFHVLSEDGWAYAREVFSKGMEASERPAGKVLEATLRAIVANLRRYMDRTDQNVNDVFAREEDLAPASPTTAAPEAAASETPAPESAAPVPNGTAEPSGTGTPAVLADDIETRIRKAYAQLAEKPNAWVSLTQLRPVLGDTPREDVDSTLRRMISMPDVRIAPFENRKALSQEDHDAAVIIGGQAKHLVLIGA